MSEPKKISFGFSKLSKKPNLLISKEPEPKTSDSVQMIQYLEEKAIKIIGGTEKVNEPLVIPMRESNKKLINLVDIVKNDFVVRAESEVKIEKIDDRNDLTLTLDELAAKELLQDLKAGKNSDDSNKINVIPTTDKVVLEGQKESTLDDYESVPITEFGKAMLRGMGWKDGLGIGKNQEVVKVAQPSIRPRGMGLGADKLTKQAKDVKPALDRDGKALSCKKGAFVKIIAGYHKGNYGTIIGFDDESGRLNVKTALNHLNISLNEFLLTPVTREEFNKSSKIINNAKYEEYIQKMKDKEKSELASKESSKIRRNVKEEIDSEGEHKSDKNRVKTELISSESEENHPRKIKEEKPDKYDKKPKVESKYSPEHNKDTSGSDNDEYDRKQREKSRKKHERDDWRQRRRDESDSEEETRKFREKSRKSEKTKHESDEKSKKTREKLRKNDKYDLDRPGKSKYETDSEEEQQKSRDKSSKREKKYETDSEEDSKKSRDKSRKKEENDKKERKKTKKKYKSDESSDESKYKRKSKKHYDDYKNRESRTENRSDRTRERSRRDDRR